MKWHARTSEIAPFEVMQIMARANQLEAGGRDVIHLEVGEPDFPPAPAVARAGQACIAAGRTGYTEALGLPALRQAIAESYATRGVSLAPERIVVTAGASGGLLLLNALLLGAQDELLITDPGYPCNSVFAQLVGARATALALRAAEGWQLTAENLSAHWGPKVQGLLVASPANPTGVMLARDTLSDCLRIVAAHNGFLIVDEIYQGLVYEDAGYRTVLEVPAAQEAPALFALNSFSKYFGMTGWRLGWDRCAAGGR